MTNGSSHSRCESNVHAWREAVGLRALGEVDHALGGRVGLEHDAEVEDLHARASCSSPAATASSVAPTVRP